jgi:hypothetical protein
VSFCVEDSILKDCALTFVKSTFVVFSY